MFAGIQDLLGPFCILSYIGIIAFLLIASRLITRRRGETLSVFARRLGFVFDPETHEGYPLWGEPFELFHRSTPSETNNHMSGVWRNIPVEVFDYTYFISGAGITRTVVAFKLPQSFPGLVIKPDPLLREFFEFIGGQDIDFESDVFNKCYYVKADDRKFAHDVIHPQMMDFLLHVRGITLQIAGRQAIFFHEKQLKPRQIGRLLCIAIDFYKNIPDFVKKDYATR